jgi:hypothetical protein
MHDFIFLAGAPGSGKTTVMRLLQDRLGSPTIEFSSLRNLHLDSAWTNASTEEEQMSFENLVFILKNYARHGYRQVLVTDLQDFRVEQLPEIFRDYMYVIFSLIIGGDEELKQRVLSPSRDSGYRDFEGAIIWNRLVQERTLLPREHRIDNSHHQPARTVDHILSYLA